MGRVRGRVGRAADVVEAVMTGAEWNNLGVDLQGEFVSLWVFLAVPIGCVVAVKVGLNLMRRFGIPI